MNIKQAHQIPIKTVLESFSLFPSKENNTQTAFYFAVDRSEKTPSLSVNFISNTVFDFGTGKKYDQISIVQAIRQCSVSDALKYLTQFQSNNISTSKPVVEDKKYVITQNKMITHPALIKYLEKRKVLEYKDQLTEIHYTSANGKNYFGVAFGNDSGKGWEFSNPIGQKICLGSKDITTIHNNSNILRITESFWDYFSILKSERLNDDLVTDYIVLNSTALFHKLPDLSNYSQIHTWLDRDKAGQDFFERLSNTYNNCLNYDIKYSGWKDANDWLQAN